LVLTEPNAQFTQTTGKQVPLTDVLLNFHTGLHKSQTPARPDDLFLYNSVQNFNTNIKIISPRHRNMYQFTVHSRERWMTVRFTGRCRSVRPSVQNFQSITLPLPRNRRKFREFLENSCTPCSNLYFI